jgi:ferredoxin-NADP reductase
MGACHVLLMEYIIVNQKTLSCFLCILRKKEEIQMVDDYKTRKIATKKNPKTVKILMTEFVTHDVKRFIVEKPEGFEFVPGQATLISIPKPKWEKEFRDFSITSTGQDRALEFTIKAYFDHDGVTKALHQLEAGDDIVIHPPYGTIQYQGRGVFLAGGAGITPFIAILRHLHKTNELKGNTLFFSNKEAKDIIIEKELRQMLGNRLVLTLTREEAKGYEHGRIDKELIQKYVKDLNQKFYICGPDAFVLDLKKALEKMGVKEENIIAESFIVADA